MSDKIKIIVNWLSEEDDELNQYRLRIYWLNSMEALVVASNITFVPGRTIADITPQIIYFVNENFDLSVNEVMLIEHYPNSNLHEDVYLHLLFVNNELTRYEIGKDRLMCLIGKQI